MFWGIFVYYLDYLNRISNQKKTRSAGKDLRIHEFKLSDIRRCGTKCMSVNEATLRPSLNV